MCTNGKSQYRQSLAAANRTSKNDTNTTVLDSDSSYEDSLGTLVGFVIPPTNDYHCVGRQLYCSARMTWLQQIAICHSDPGIGEGKENVDDWEGSFGIVTSHSQQVSTQASSSRPLQWGVRESLPD